MAPAPAPAPAPLEQLPLRNKLSPVLQQPSRLSQVQVRRCGTAQYSTAWTDAVSVTRPGTGKVPTDGGDPEAAQVDVMIEAPFKR